MDPDALVTVGTYSNSVEAHMDRAVLENAGIQAFVLHENSGYTPATIELELQVRAEDLENARRVIAEQHETNA
jgi:nitrogen regulatory protein PII-like uncharacterized protein